MNSYDFAIEEINGGNLDETRYIFLLKTLEHQTRHRGQTIIYTANWDQATE